MKDPLSLDSYSQETDLQELLIANAAHEGVYFEFKGDYTGQVGKKLGKHVAAFANSHGGLLAIGVKAVDSVATELTGVDPPAKGFEESVSQKIASKVRPVPQFALKVVPLDSGRVVMLIRVDESAYPPHLFDGMIYVRNAAESDPVLADNRAEIDRMYQKSARVNQRLDQALKETWFSTLTRPNPTAHLIACPLVVMEDLVPDYDARTISVVERLADRIQCGRNVCVASNEYRARNSGDTYVLRVARYGLVEFLVEAANSESPTVFWTIELERSVHLFLHGVTEFYRWLRFSGTFRLILGVRRVQGKATSFLMKDVGKGPARISYECERERFTVERVVSMGGDNDVLDDVSRKQIAESMIREYVANFGVGKEYHYDAITCLVYLKREDTKWQ